MPRCEDSKRATFKSLLSDEEREHIRIVQAMIAEALREAVKQMHLTPITFDWIKEGF